MIHSAANFCDRTSWHYYFSDANERAAQVADWMAEILGWSDSVKEEQLLRYQKSSNAELPKFSSTSNMALSPK